MSRVSNRSASSRRVSVRRRPVVWGVRSLTLAAFFALALGAWAASAGAAASRTRTGAPLGFTCTMTGTNGNDVLTGTSGDDTICGLNGNDTIRGLGGNDTLVGGDGNDTLLPGPGNDTVEGDAGTNTLAYSDITSAGVTVNLQTATASGSQAGSDTLSGIQNVNGSDQADSITGDGNANLLNGLGGADQLNGAGGNDNLSPGLGNDPSVNGGSGDDYVNYSAITGTGVVVNLTTLAVTGAAGSDTLSNIEWAIGTNQNDTLRGSAGDNLLKGLGGNDQLFGNNGNDTLLPGAGTNSVDGGNGGDWASYSDITGGGVTVNLGTSSVTGPGVTDTLSFVEKAIGTNQDDSMTGDGSANTLNALAGSDSLFGMGGIDTLVPGTGNDPTTDGGGGSDYVSYGDLASGGVTVDLSTQSASGPSAGTDPLTSIENATGSNQADTITGDTGPNTVYGLGGADVISVGEGNNTVFGGDGDDLITAGTGDDTIDGGSNTTGNPGDQCFADGGTNTVTNCETTNRAPVAFDDPAVGQEANFTTDQNTAFNTGDVTANDTDLDGDSLAVNTLDVTGTDGLVTQNPDNKTFHYDPNGFFDSLPAGQTATDTFKYTVSDGHGGTSNEATVTITINGLNDAPTATDDSGAGFGTDQNTSFTTGNVLPNDSDPDTGDTLSVSNLDTTNTDGTVTDNGDGTFDYDPNGAFDYLGTGQSANDTFDYTVSDGHGGTDTATVTIHVTGLNDAPTAFDDSGASFTTNEDSSFTTGSVLSNDVDPDTSDTLSVSNLDTTGTVGTVTNNNDGTFGYNPNGLFNSLSVGQTANDTFHYTVSDGHGGTDTAAVTITITGVNDAPTAVDDTKSTNEDTSTGFDPRTNDSDPDSADTLTITGVNTTGTIGGVTITGGGTGISYNPAGHFDSLNVGDSASDSFTYTISDGHGGTDTATVNLTITGVNDNPVGVTDAYGPALANTKFAVGTTPGGPVITASGKVLTNDTDVDDPQNSLTATSGTSSTTNGGSVTMNSDGSFVYTPPVATNNGSGSPTVNSDSFTYTVNDPHSGSSSGTVNLSIQGPIVWYVDNSLGSAGDGRSTSPFNSIAPLTTGGGSDAKDGTGDIIFVYQGSSAYTGGLVLETNQKLWGQPNGLTVNSTTLVAAGGSAPSITNAGGNGVTLASGADLQGLALGNSSGAALSGSGLSSATAGSSTAVSINNGTGKAVDISSSTVTMTFSSVTSTGSATQGINLSSVNGSFTANGGSISTATGNDIDLNGGTANFTYTGTVSNTAARAVSVQNKTAGTVSFSGNITDSGGTGVFLNSNTGTTMSFTSGNLNLAPGAGGQAFTATGGGTVNVTGANNVLNSTTGAALDVENTTIGGSNMTFKSISAGPASFTGSPTNGIVLTNTGTSGTFTIAGTGSAGTGGTIRNTSGDGIALTTVQNVSLNWMSVTSNKGNGIHGSGVTGLTLANATISGNGDNGGSEDGVLMQNLLGTNSMSNLNVSGSSRHNIGIINSSGTLTSLSITGSTIHDNSSTGSNGLTVIADGTAVMNGVSVSTTNFTSNHTAGIQAQTLNGGSLTLTVTGGTYSNNFNAVDFDHAATTTGTFTTTFTGATITNGATGCAGTLPCGAPINLFLGSLSSNNAASIFRATVTNNTVNNGGSTSAPGIWFHTGNPVRGHARLLITGNNVSNVGNRGIEVDGGGCTTGQTCDDTVDATIQNNTVTLTDALNSLEGIFINDGTNTADTQVWCADISGNNSSSAGASGIRVRQRQLTTLRLPSYGGAQFSGTDVVNYLTPRNPATSDTISADSSSAGGGFQNAGASCLTP